MFDERAGTVAERKAVEAARASYAASREHTHHSADALLRMQAASSLAERGLQSPPPAPDVSRLRSGAAPSADVLQASLRSGVAFYQTLQAPDGHFPGDYGGPMFLMPGLVITLHVTGAMDTVLSAEHKREMIRYLCNHANPDGGCARCLLLLLPRTCAAGAAPNSNCAKMTDLCAPAFHSFGLHIEGHSTMFGTVLSYVTLRLLGADASHATCAAARRWLLSHGGATAIPSWGKFWLAVLGVYEWYDTTYES